MAKKKTAKVTVPKDLRDSAHKIWLAGLGALAVAEEEGTKLFKTLVDKGESFESRSKKHLDKVVDKVEGAKDAAEAKIEALGDTFDDRVASTLKKMGVPSREEIQKLTKRVEELTLKADKAKPTTRRRTTSTKSRKSA